MVVLLVLQYWCSYWWCVSVLLMVRVTCITVLVLLVTVCFSIVDGCVTCITVLVQLLMVCFSVVDGCFTCITVLVQLVMGMKNDIVTSRLLPCRLWILVINVHNCQHNILMVCWYSQLFQVWLMTYLVLFIVLSVASHLQSDVRALQNIQELYNVTFVHLLHNRLSVSRQ